MEEYISENIAENMFQTIVDNFQILIAWTCFHILFQSVYLVDNISVLIFILSAVFAVHPFQIKKIRRKVLFHF